MQEADEQISIARSLNAIACYVITHVVVHPPWTVGKYC